jgi:hypothetical protein
LRAGAEHNEEVKAKLEDCLKQVDERVEDVREFIAGNGKGEAPVLEIV